MAVANDEPVLELNGNKYIISELPRDAQYCIAHMTEIQAEIDKCGKELDRHRAAYAGFQIQLEKIVEPKSQEEGGEDGE